MLPVSLQVLSIARQERRAPSLHQRETPIEANSTKASDESDLDTLDLKENELVRNGVRDEKVKKR